MCEACWSEADDEDVVCLLDMGSTYCSDAARGGFHHGSLLEGEFRRQRDYGSSRYVVFWDPEVFCEAARVDVGLLEFGAKSKISSRTVYALVTRYVVMCYYPVARLVSGRVLRDSFDCAAHFMA